MLKSSQSVEHPLDSQGIWCQILRHPAPERPALFLDRDGAIVEDRDYLRRVDDIVVIPRAAEVIAAANEQSVPVIMVTNQSGIGRGYMAGLNLNPCRMLLSLCSLRKAPGSMRSMPAPIIRKPRAFWLTRIIRRANPILACCYKRLPRLRSI